MQFLLYYSLILSFLLWIISLLLLSSFLKNSTVKLKLIKKLSLAFSIFQFILILIFWIFSDYQTYFSDFEIFNFSFYFKWLEMFNFYFVIGIDNISLMFLVLTFLLTSLNYFILDI